MAGKKESSLVGISTEFKNHKEKGWIPLDEPSTKKARPSVLLHSCCGPCSTAVIERLAADYQVTVYFYNPNITDRDEYLRRREAQQQCINAFNEDPTNPWHIGFMEGEYEREEFFVRCKGLEEQPEGGRRCEVCYKMRLEKTAQMAGLIGYDLFTTTLSVSPHKDYSVISHIGKSLAATYGVGFLDQDFKKKAGFQRSVELSKKYNLYRQDYCGCVFANYHLKKENQENV